MLIVSKLKIRFHFSHDVSAKNVLNTRFQQHFNRSFGKIQPIAVYDRAQHLKINKRVHGLAGIFRISQNFLR